MDDAAASSSHCSSALDILSQDCLIVCLEFLNNTSDFDWFRWSSRRNCAVYNDFLRIKFQCLGVLFEGMTRQQRIRSWTDIELEIPIIPGFYFTLNRMRGYITLYQYHRNSKKSIIRGITTENKLPFLSFLLQSTFENGTLSKTILLCLFHENSVHQILLYDEFGRTRLFMFGPEDLETLLSGRVISHRSYRHEGWLQGKWRLSNLSRMVKDTPSQARINVVMINSGDCCHCGGDLTISAGVAVTVVSCIVLVIGLLLLAVIHP